MSEYKITTALITTMVVTWLTTASGAFADTLITNARIIDGTGAPAVLGSVRLSGDRIAALGDGAPRLIIDAGCIQPPLPDLWG